MEHREIREHLGAYVLGALDPAERQLVDRHLSMCSSCRDELATLSSTRTLLDRLTLDDLAVAEDLVPDAGGAVAVLQRARRRQRRELWGWRAVAAAAVVAVALVVVAPWERPRVGSPFEVSEVAAAAAGAGGSADAYAWEWGTTVQLDLTSLPRREGYVVWVVAQDGRREQAGTWGPTAAGGARVRGASAIRTTDIVRVEITDRDGTLLLVLTPLATSA